MEQVDDKRGMYKNASNRNLDTCMCFSSRCVLAGPPAMTKFSVYMSVSSGGWGLLVNEVSIEGGKGTTVT